jgi:hypothetical protein
MQKGLSGIALGTSRPMVPFSGSGPGAFDMITASRPRSPSQARPLSRYIKAIPGHSGIARAKSNSMALSNGGEAFGWTTASHPQWRHRERRSSKCTKPQMQKGLSGIALASSSATAEFTGTEAASNTTMASHPAWERQARPPWKYIKGILAHSGLTRDKIRRNRRVRAAPEQGPCTGRGLLIFRTWPG